ncbi:MAG TPA: hypothetical protein VJ938_10610 [Acidimicrobiia bacterium]|nr:hypothetical protein [Acidimicrobiia bacterium]
MTNDEILQAIADELAEPKYRLGESWWTRVVDWLQEMWTRFLEWATDISEVVGGPLVLGLIVGGALLALAVVVTANLGRRRARLVDERIRREYEAARGLDPADLERQALEAEERSDYETALRLLFRAGLIRLDRSGLIDLRPGTTSGTITATVPGFAALAERFDVVVYGDAAATADDPRLARSVLAELLTGAGR